MINIITSALSGLAAASKIVEASANNIANVSTSGAINDGNGPAPYEAQTIAQQSVQPSGVRSNIVPKNTGFTPAFDPDSPFANEDGIIGVPNVNLAEEAVNLQLAEVTYKANLKVLGVASDLSNELLDSLDRKA